MPTTHPNPEILLTAGGLLAISAAGYRFVKTNKHGALNSVVGILSVLLMGFVVDLILNAPK